MIRYVRLDGTYFMGPVFHRQMEYADVEDPRDGQLHTYRSEVDSETQEYFRVEVS